MTVEHTAPVVASIPESPYRGIESYRYVDQQIFPAREEETWRLLSRIIINRGALLYGESGVGKSSLINAGLIPALLEENFIPNRLRIQPIRGREFKIERIPASDSANLYLPSIFIGNEQNVGHLSYSIDELKQRLESFRLADDRPRSDKSPLLIFDQFEEFITLFEEAAREAKTEKAREDLETLQTDILHTLVSLMQDDSLAVKILFVFRQDYLAKLNLLFRLCPDLLNKYVQVLPPRINQLSKIIRAPFDKFPGGFGTEISPELAQGIVAEIKERSEGGTINLTEVQIVCLKLWESSDPDALFRQKKVGGILEDYFVEALNELDEDWREPALILLGNMLTASNTRNIISGVDLIKRFCEDEKVAQDKLEETERKLMDILVALDDMKLVRRERRDKGVFFYEIASEFLVQWIIKPKAEREARLELRRREEEAKQKLEQERERAKQLEVEQRLIQAQLEVERQKASRWLWLVVGLALLLTAIIIFAIFIDNQRAIAVQAKKDALEQRAIAQQQKIIADSESERAADLLNLLPLLMSTKAVDRLTAVKQIDALAKENKLPSEVWPVLLNSIATDKDPEVSKAALETIRQAIATNPELAKYIVVAGVASDIAEMLPPRIYIQVESDAQLERAHDIKAEMEAKGYVVPGIEVVGAERSPDQTQLRYYLPSDKSKANEILRLLRSLGVEAQRRQHLGKSAKIRPGHFELWFAAESQTSSEEGNAPWFVIIDYKPETPIRKQTLQFLLTRAIIGTDPDIQMSFPSTGQARIGPYERQHAEQVKAGIVAALERFPQPLGISIEKD